MMGIFEAIDKLITERGSAAILRERLAWLREQWEAVQNQVTELQKENTRLKSELEQAHRDLAAHASAEKFVEHRGALFERMPAGGYSLGVRCPTCRRALSLVVSEAPFYCSRCRHHTQFNAGELKNVMNELP